MATWLPRLIRRASEIYARGGATGLPGTMDAPVVTSYTPMAPMQVREPFHCDGYVFEEKCDGWRMLAYKHAGAIG